MTTVCSAISMYLMHIFLSTCVIHAVSYNYDLSYNNDNYLFILSSATFF